MTNILQFDIITLALSEGNKKSRVRRGANLENDTEKREKSIEPRCDDPRKRGALRGDGTVRIRRVKRREVLRVERFGECEAGETERRRIKHQSLILAQDERWRRA